MLYNLVIGEGDQASVGGLFHPLHGAFDQAVGLVRRPKYLVVVLHPERGKVERDVVLVRER